MIAWSHRLAERTDKDLPPFFELATTLIGSGGTGITARQSAQLIAQGVREANERLEGDGSAEADEGLRTRPMASERRSESRGRSGRRSAICTSSSSIWSAPAKR